MRTALFRITVAASLVAGGVAAFHADAAAALTAHGSVNQVYATGLTPSTQATLLTSAGKVVQTKRATTEGGVLFYQVAPGSYTLKVGAVTSSPVTVHNAASTPWDTSFYKQSITSDGYGYLTTRDGTQLAYTVHPPTVPAGLGTPDATLPAGPAFAPPYPTLIEYSGYGYARPSGPENGIAVLANAMGFAVVDINMRGTGCSSGAFNFFEPLQGLDGYDIVETVAHQPWVKGGKVGMMGISYGGISQLFTAQYQPPDLAAISPLSVIDTTPTTLYPGGLLNTGFAVAWANERQQNAQAATKAGRGQSWAWDRIQAGDTVCKANQALHGEAQDLPATIAANTHYDNPAYIDSIDPVTFVDKIKVPVFMACQFEDEQTGGHCPTLVRHFTGTSKKWFTFTNGAHIDSLDPPTYVRWFDFLQLYVAKIAPGTLAGATFAAAPVVYNQAMGINSAVAMPADPIWAQPTYDSALAAYEKIPSVRVLFDNGAGSTGQPGDPNAAYGTHFPTFPIPGTQARTWYLGPKGSLTDKQSGTGIDSYTSNVKALPANDFTGSTGGGGLWGNASQWSWNWKSNPAGSAVAYVSAPLKADTTVVGAGAVSVWLRSSTPDVDLVATVSEVSAAGNETFVQNGFLRASERKLETRSHSMLGHPSSLLEPVPSFRSADAAPMPAGKFVKVTIPLYYEGHAYRAGTRIRITIAAPNGTQPIWSFAKTSTALTKVSVQFSPSMPSSLVLPVIPGVAVPTGQPACPSLRNEPCRPYVALPNNKG
ncbi:MAG: peptidase [Frankiales bacterium]|nr:peptidase [Frankiales bacterium]